MAQQDFIVEVSRFTAGATTGSSYSPVLRIELLDPHVQAAKTTFNELARRFPATEGFKLDLGKRQVVVTPLASNP